MKKGSPLLKHHPDFIVDAESLFETVSCEFATSRTFSGMLDQDYLMAFHGRLVEAIAMDLLLLSTAGKGSRVLSVGGWPGLTSLALASRGYEVVLIDHPNVMDEQAVARFRRHGIEAIPLDLADVSDTVNLPILGDFALVECCECIEHWNFHPLPLLGFFVNLIKVKSGALYVTVPNLASLFQRIRLLFGKSIYGSFDAFEYQLKNVNEDYDHHWREYTRTEFSSLLKALDTDDVKTWFQYHYRGDKGGVLRAVFNVAQYIIPGFREHLGAVVKVSVGTNNNNKYAL